MKRFLLLVCFLLLTTPVYAGDYILGPGDTLAMSVWGFDELEAKEITIRPDGKIGIPLAGEITAEGLTVAELNNLVTTALSEYIKEPKVTLNVAKFRTTRVYVFGEVKKQGLHELVKSHNLLDALGIAEGYTKEAYKRKVAIIHKDQKDKKYTTVNLLDLLTKGDMTQNYTLREGDVVYVSPSKGINFARDILPFLTAIKYIDDINNDD